MNFSKMKFEELKVMAVELNVYPEEGSGKGGKVVKKDLIAALTVSENDTEEVPETEALTNRYLFDRDYVVLEPFAGHEKGAKVSNLSRSIGQQMLDEGKIKLDAKTPARSNPRL